MFFCIPSNTADVTGQASAAEVAPAEAPAAEQGAPATDSAAPAGPEPAKPAAPDSTAPAGAEPAAQEPATTQPTATRSLDGTDGSDSKPTDAWGANECHPDNPLASSLKHCRTYRDGTLGSLWLGVDFGFAALSDDTEKRIKAGPGIAVQVRLGAALWDQLVIGLAFSSMTLRDKAGYTIWVTECTTVGRAVISCEDEPEEVGSELDANLGAMELGYQYRFRPWAPISIVPGMLVGYTFALRGLERTIGCDDCGRVPLDVDLNGAYLAPFLRVTFGRTGPVALTVRPQYFLNGALHHITYAGLELGMP